MTQKEEKEREGERRGREEGGVTVRDTERRQRGGSRGD